VRITVGVIALGGLLVWEAWSERVRHRVALLLERLPELLVLVTADLTSWQLAMTQASEAMEEFAACLLESYRFPVIAENAGPFTHTFSGSGYTVTRPDHEPQPIDMADIAWSTSVVMVWPPDATWPSWTQAPDDSWIDSYSGQGEELEALEQVIEEQRERIRRIGSSETVTP